MPLSISLIMKPHKLLESNTFQLQRDLIYKQTNGVVMGPPVFPIAVNLFISHIESLILASNIRPLIWLRYIDEIFVIFKKTLLSNFSKHINTLSEHIKFTFEMKMNMANYLSSTVQLKGILVIVSI